MTTLGVEEWVSTPTLCCSLDKKVQIRYRKHEGAMPIPRMPTPAIQLGVCQSSPNLDSAERQAAMALPYRQARLLFISSPLKASGPFIDFPIKPCYISLRSKMEKTGAAEATWSPCQRDFLDHLSPTCSWLNHLCRDTALWLHLPKVP